MRPTQIKINLPAVISNFRLIKKYAPVSKIMAMVKANAYGHGIREISRCLADLKADALAVCSLEEALDINQGGVGCPLVVLEGFYQKKEIKYIAEFGFIPVIHNLKQVELLEKSAGRLKIILKIDSGMHRLGLTEKEFINAVNKLGGNYEIFALMSHFANADDIDHPLNSRQISKFDRICGDFPFPHTLANSAAILSLPASHRTWVRPGIMLYGSNPMLHGSAADFGLLPTMSFTTELMAIKEIPKGEAVGYGSNWICDNNTCRIGVAAAGYGDGYPRHAPNGTPVAVGGVKAPLAGRVSMDMITIDLSSVPHARLGDPVELWGERVKVDEVARRCGTISYELFCGITARVRREYMQKS